MTGASTGITHSLLDGASLLSELRKRYALGAAATCQLWQPGDSDLYLVTDRGSAWMARLYQHTKATRASVETETEIVASLNRRGLPVAAPIETEDGRLTITIQAPEGPRQLTLVPRVKGIPPRQRLTAAQASAYGQVVAQLHEALDDIQPAFTRPVMDDTTLIERPIQQTVSALAGQQVDVDYFERLAKQLPLKINLPRVVPSWGLCHGDLHKSNILFDENGHLTVIDWECCARSWRAYELSVLRWSLGPALGPDGLGETATAELWSAYLTSYTAMRPLSDAEIASIPYFVAARHLWNLGVNLQHVADGHWGTSYIHDFLPHSVDVLRWWIASNCPDLDL